MNNDKPASANDPVTFDSWADLEEYIANTVAEFVRDNMFELNDHPMDYQDHFEFIKQLYMKWLEEVPED